ncbi:hypothetical protein J437_LFUL001015 [Ladona fulva]|uniref:Transmembrane protein n=1 Tax=Ladona fulva TaxID=123851 RepID=A0A8K0KE63_LADFU|nr:hypothetical protein J437_LFUL001015 [Ladona fulva]
MDRKSSRKNFMRLDRVKQRKHPRNRYKVPEEKIRASTSAKKLRIADTCFDIDSSIAYHILNFFALFWPLVIASSAGSAMLAVTGRKTKEQKNSINGQRNMHPSA